MKKIMVMIPAVVISLFLTACSTLIPYEENFACRNRDNLGKCIDVEKAYDEAAEDIHRYPHFDEKAKGTTAPEPGAYPGSSTGQPNSVTGAFHTYKEREYNELAALIEQPVTPMVKPPRVIRTLIFPYVGRQDDTNGYLYMPRYVYSILEEKQWVIGNYLRGTEGLTDNLVNPKEEN